MTTQGPAASAPGGRKSEPAQRSASSGGEADLLPLHAPILGRSRLVESQPMADLAELKTMIEAALPGAEVEVSDEDGGGQHLRAVVTAPQFEGLSRIDQHRLVKAAVKERFDDGTIHALSVKTAT